LPAKIELHWTLRFERDGYVFRGAQLPHRGAQCG
jgi:hypothetical protein